MSDSDDDLKYQVSFTSLEDPEDPLAIGETHKWLIVILVSLTSVCITSISSVWSLASPQFMDHFNVSHEVSTLGISLYIFCLGTGGIFLSPISEFHGRKVVYTTGLIVVFAFQFPPAFSDNIGFILFSRAIAGFFASSFMSVASGTFSDLFKKTDRTSNFKKDQSKELNKALVIYSASPFLGPGIGPLISGLVCYRTSFRWVFYIMAIWSGVMALLVILFVPETYEPVLLRRKAQRLRSETGDSSYYAPIDKERKSLFETILLSSKRPILLIFKDYMTMALCFYTGFTLAVVYMFFVSVPYIFKTVYGFNLYQQGLSFLGLIVGFLLTTLATPALFEIWHQKLIKKNGGHVTEQRLLPLMVGVFIVPVGLFILAWTSYLDVHWIAPIIGSAVYGSGVVLLFNGIIAYTVEAYRKYTASAVATNSFVRSVMSAAFPLFALELYRAWGVQWSTTFLALFSCALIPVPFVFYRYGAKLRARSPYTWSE